MTEKEMRAMCPNFDEVETKKTKKKVFSFTRAKIRRLKRRQSKVKGD